MSDRIEEAAWLEWRRGGVTATDVADAANGTYGGSYGVVARKLGLITTEQNQFMDRGTRWQERIADAVNVLTGKFVCGEEAWCALDEDDRWRATVDGFLGEFPDTHIDDVLGVVEIKTRGRNVRPNRQRWADQIQWQMLVTGTKAALLAEAVIADAIEADDEVCDSVHLTEIEADGVRQEFLIGVAEFLWTHIQQGTLPEPDDPSALETVKEVRGQITEDDTADLSGLADQVRRFHEIKAAMKAVKDEHDLLEAQIREAVGGHKGGKCSGFKVTVAKPRQVMTDELEQQYLALHPEHARTVLDRELAKREAKDDYEAHRAAVGARTLTISETEDD